MHITRSTDYSLRTLMLLASLADNELVSIEQISDTLKVSRTHLMKIVNQLAQLNVVETVRGRNGGVRIQLDHSQINIGEIFRQIESVDKVVDCERGPCVFIGACQLQGAVDRATNAFLQELDRYTLADLMQPPARIPTIVTHGTG